METTLTNSKRVRRTPEEARRLILDAAEASMAKSGPAGIRLQEVAEAAGVSHPTILHHFESREGLIRALNLRTLSDLRQVLTRAIGDEESTGADAVAATFAAYRDGLAQRIVWMLQTLPAPAPGAPQSFQLFDDMVDMLHQTRLKFAPPGAVLDRYDSWAIVHLTTIAALGDALIGQRLRRGQSEAEERAAQGRFELWLARLIGEHIESVGRGLTA
jgi:AcrR family transcriptional regulator